MNRQTPLPLSFAAELGFDEFHAGGNAETVAHLRRCAAGTGEPLLFLWSEAGQGKTHLLNACCREAYRLGRSAAYLPLAGLKAYGPDILDGQDAPDLVCLDDVDAIAAHADWEQAVFHLFNRRRDAERALIVAAAAPPNELKIGLADLKSRLSWGLTLALRPLSDDDRLAALSLHARSLGLDLPPPVGRFLLARFPRDLPSLRALLEQLDRATLAAQRKLTIPFLKTYLEERS